MDEKTQRAFTAWSNRADFTKLVIETTMLIRHHVEHEKCMVAYSGGKDSLAMLHLTLQVQPNIDVFIWDQGSHIMPREVHTEILANAEKLGAKNVIVESLPCQQNPKIRSSPQLWGLSHRWRYQLYAELKKRYCWQTEFIGLRAEESCSRKRVCLKPRTGEVYPLADWSFRDVWGYIISRNLPYPKAYDVYGPLLGWDKARFVNFYSGRFENFGSPYLDGFFFPQFHNI